MAKCVSPEPYMKIRKTAQKMEIANSILVPYRKACEEGWAPMPTNAIQKAIWDEVKAKKATNTSPSAMK